MHPDAARFIDLAVRPLADNAELELAARAELGKNIGSRAENILAAAAGSLAHADARPHRLKWRIALYIIALIASLPLLIHEMKRVTSDWGILRSISPFHSAEPDIREIPNLTARQKLLLYGDSSASDEAGRWKPLWQSEPENPAYLAQYTAAYMNSHKKPSSEILAAAEKVDPDNGWFLAQAAVGAADQVVTRAKRSKKEIAEGKAAVLTVYDEKLLNESLDLIHRAVEKPRLDAYRIPLFRERISLFPPRYDYVSRIPLWGYAASESASNVGIRKLTDVLAASAQQCAAKGDTAGFRTIITDWYSLAHLLSKDAESLVDLLIAKVMISGAAENFRDDARLLGLEREAQYFEKLSTLAKAEKDRRELAQANLSANDHFLLRRNSILGGMISNPLVGKQVKSAPPLADADQLPARYVDHAVLGRVLSGMGWMLMGLVVGLVALIPYRDSPLVRRLSVRMLDLLHRSDWVWLFLGGMIFPVFWYFWIFRMTPFAAREWSVGSLEFFPIFGQFGSFLTSLIILPMVIAGFLLKKRGAALGFTPRFSWLGWIAVAAVLAAVPVFGALPMEKPVNPWAFVSSFILAGTAVVWILGGLILRIFGNGPQSLRRATVARMILPVFMSSLLILALAIPFHYSEEKYWVRQDHFGAISNESPALSHYEYLVAQVLRRENLEMLGEAP